MISLLECYVNGTFEAGDHIVQKPPYWSPNWGLGYLKNHLNLNFLKFVLDVPVRNLLFSIYVGFCTMRSPAAKGPLLVVSIDK